MQRLQIDPRHWAELNRLLDAALDLPESAREQWLATLDEHEALKPQLRELLLRAARIETRDFLETLPKLSPGVEDLADAASASEHEGACIGSYRLVRELGAGGMGSVWLAERIDGLIKRPVALKLPHIASKRIGLAERMAREREILATLTHPNIARLYDAGVTAEGRPYLALEYVEGKPIDVYSNEHQLDLRSRLNLFLQVANAVAYAHAKLIIHRDLKPANILVTSEGEVRLLDFGVAKLLDEGQAKATQLTELSGRALTPDYASPEQILGEPLTIATDLYSLGVVLFELLTGARPYKLKRDSRGALEDAIVQNDPPKPSDTVEPAKRKALRGDLDTIVLKALKKQQAERYATVNGFAEDVLRYLEQRPVLARRDSAWYRVGKFSSRHKLGVAAAAAVLLAIMAGAGVAVWQARLATLEKQRAEQVKDFIASLFEDSNPYLGGGRKVTVDELLMQSKAKIDARFRQQPAIRAELLLIVGTSLEALGESEAARPIIIEAAADAERSLGDEHVVTLHAQALLLGQQRSTDRSGVASGKLDKLLAAMRRNPDVDPAHLVNALTQRTHIALSEGAFTQAAALAEEALGLSIDRIGPEAEQTLVVATMLAIVHQRAGDWKQALAAAQRVHDLAFKVRRFPDEHPNAVDARIMHGMALADSGQLAPGLQEISDGVRYSVQSRSPGDPAIGSFRGHLARYQLRAGLTEEAITSYSTALEILRAGLGVDNRMYAAASANLGRALLSTHRAEPAAQLLSDAHGYFKDMQDVLTDPARAGYAASLSAAGRVAEGMALIRGWSASSTSPSWETFYYRGVVMRAAGNLAAALALQRQALGALIESPATAVDRGRVSIEIGLNMLGQNQAIEAVQTLERAVDLLRASQLQMSPPLADALVGLGRARLESNEPSVALPTLSEADAYWRDFDPGNRMAGEAALWLGRCYATLGRTNEADEALRRAEKVLSGSSIAMDADLAQLARQR